MTEASGTGSSLIAGRVRPPAIGLIAIAVLGIVVFMIAVVRGPQDPGELVRMLQERGVSEEEARHLAELVTSPLFRGVGVVSILVYAFVLWAGLQMLRLESRIAAVVASVLVMVPCNLTCVLGLPVGIWSLVVLFDQDVKRAFEGGEPPAEFTT